MTTTRTSRTFRRLLAAALAAGALTAAVPATAGAGGHPPVPEPEIGIPTDPCDDLLISCPHPDGGDPEEPDEPEEPADEPDEPQRPERNPDVVVAEPNFTG